MDRFIPLAFVVWLTAMVPVFLLADKWPWLVFLWFTAPVWGICIALFIAPWVYAVRAALNK